MEKLRKYRKKMIIALTALLLLVLSVGIVYGRYTLSRVNVVSLTLKHTVTITYNANPPSGKTAEDVKGIPSPKKLVEEGERLKYGELPKDKSEGGSVELQGYKLTGWYLDAACSDNKKVEPTDEIGEVTEVTLYAKWQNPTHVSLPEKGDLIRLDGKTGTGLNNAYRVIKVDGTNVEVLAMTGTNIPLNSSEHRTTMGGITVEQYKGSTLDNYLNGTNSGDYYNSLSSNIKAAIVAQDITQTMVTRYYEEPEGSSWKLVRWNNSTYQDYWVQYYPNVFEVVGKRNVYCLEFKDIINYFEGAENISPEKINFLYWNSEGKRGGSYSFITLRDAYAPWAGHSVDWGYYTCMDGVTGGHSSSARNNPSSARAAFTIDISKVSWEKI